MINLQFAPHKVISAIALLLLGGCFADDPDMQIDQSIQGLYDGALSTNGQYSLIASIHHGASLWRIKDGERLYNWNHTSDGFTQISHVAISNNGRIALTAFQRELASWSQKNGKSIQFWQLPSQISCLSMNGNGTYALVGMDSGQAMIIDMANNGFAWSYKFPDEITACDITPTTNGIAIGTQQGGVYAYQVRRLKNKKDKTAPAQLKLGKILELEHPYAISQVSLLPKSKLLSSASRHNQFILTDLKSKEPIYEEELKNASVSGVKELDKYIVISKTNRQIDFINQDNWETVKTVQVPKRNQWKPSGVYISDFTIAQDNLIVTGSDGVTQTFNALNLP